MSFFRQRRSIRIAKGIRLNLGKKGITSVSMGGARFPLSSGRSSSSSASGLGGCIVGAAVLGVLCIFCSGVINVAINGVRLSREQHVSDSQTEPNRPVQAQPVISSDGGIEPRPTGQKTRERRIVKNTIIRYPENEGSLPETKSTLSERHVSSILTPKELPSTNAYGEPLRDWRAKDRNAKITATLKSFDAGTRMVTLAREDGKVSTFALDKLNEADQWYVRQQCASRVNYQAAVVLGPITRVIDADTVEIENPYINTKVIRFSAIDGPEEDQPFGKEAKELLEAKLMGKEVRIEYDAHSIYDRIVGDVYLDGEWINAWCVAQGIAWRFTKYSRHTQLQELEAYARANKIGLWSLSKPVQPWYWRDGIKPMERSALEAGEVNDDTVVFLTDKGLFFHSAGCTYLHDGFLEIPLQTAKQSYKPCSHCLP